MAKRIRYGKDGVSVQNVSAPNGTYSVMLNVEAKTFTIVDANTKVEVVSGSGPSMSTVKLKAKKALMGLGVVFDAEKRVKGANA